MSAFFPALAKFWLHIYIPTVTKLKKLICTVLHKVLDAQLLIYNAVWTGYKNLHHCARHELRSRLAIW